MKTDNDNYQLISDTLVKSGVFAISDIEGESSLSREGIKKNLHFLVKDSILKKTAEQGRNVKYKLAITDDALEFLFTYIEQMTIEEFARAWNIGDSATKKYMKQFVDDGVVEKIGTPPRKIIYVYVKETQNGLFSREQREIIEKNYAFTTPEGRFLKGVKGFMYWAETRSGRKDIENLAQEYINVRNKYYDQKANILLIDATEKLTHIFNEDVAIEKLFHCDFDALPVFGKTYLSQMVRIAKSGQTNTALMMSIVEKMQGGATHIIKQYDIDCIGYIPPTVVRKTQLMTFIAKQLQISCDRIILTKETSLVPVQQKSLKKVEDRKLNAQKTIVVESKKKYKNILLIDDVTGSGATLNETAKKLIAKGIAQRVYAFTITGSAKAGVFDIISEA